MKGFRRVEQRLKVLCIFLTIVVACVVAVQFLDISAHLKSAWTVFLILTNLALVRQLYKCASYFLLNSTKDELTGVYNYRYFITRLEEEMSRSVRYQRPLVLAFIDCDNFKNFNDNYGHMEGNSVLKQIGKILKENTRSSDIVARFGGDEFAVIFPEIGLTNARAVMERARAIIENAVFKVEPGEVTVSISLVNYDGEDLNVFLERADAYLYKAKMDRKNRVVEQQA
ncbi:MAG: hypothetical protein HPY66_1329 [Firmicutes bacterium]|nr:hypothetical protein [Bacillota bacterium]